MTILPPTVYLDTPNGVRLGVLNDYQGVEYVRSENDVGSLTIALPEKHYDRTMFYKDGLIEVWQSPAGGEPFLDTDTLWMIRRVQYKVTTSQYVLTAYDLNHLLTRRAIDYNAGNAFTEKLDNADNMGKEIINENFGAGATDTTRSIAAYLTIDVGESLAPVIRQSISRQGVLKVLQNIAAASYQLGTYLTFDVICSRPPVAGVVLQLQFRSYTKQRGVDRTFAGGNPLYLGPDFGNMVDVEIDEDFSDEYTRSILLGQGVGDLQAVQRVDDAARIGQSPFGLIEDLKSSSGALVAADLLAEAQANLRKGVSPPTITGTLINTAGIEYGIDWHWGDLLPVQVNSQVYNCHASRVHYSWDRDTGPRVQPTFVLAVA